MLHLELTTDVQADLCLMNCTYMPMTSRVERSEYEVFCIRLICCSHHLEAATVPVEKPLSPEWHGKFGALGA